MMSAWKPGDVAWLTVHGESSYLGMYSAELGGSWVTAAAVAGVHHHATYDVTNARPVVVIDPENREQVRGVLEAYGKQFSAWEPETDVNVTRLQAALRGLITPPRLDEPNVWGVVEASCVHSDQRRNWIRHDDDNWWPAEKYSHADQRVKEGRDPRLPDDWDSLIDPVLVREGVMS